MRQERIKEAGPCTCGSDDVVVETENPVDGQVTDGDTSVCQSCGKEGLFCGSPSDGIGTDWAWDFDA